MKTVLHDVYAKVTSRKFLAFVAAFVASIVAHQPALAAGSTAVYVLAEAFIDAQAASK